MSTPIYSSEIAAVEFGVNGTEAVLKESNISVNSYDLFSNNEPRPGGVYDAHFGTTDPGYKCATCYLPKSKCLGHDGHLQLNYSVRSPMFYGEIKKLLKLICFVCGQVVINEDEYINLPRKRRLDEASKRAKTIGKACVKCAAPHPNITKDNRNPMNLLADYGTPKHADKRPLYPHHIREIFGRITQETTRNIGLVAHPKDFILAAVKIPSTVIRPDIRKIDGGRSTNDDLTTLIQFLVKINMQLPSVIPPEIDIKLAQAIAELESAYYNFVRGGTGTQGKPVLKTGGKVLISVAARLKGKEGRFRKTQLGKRCFGMTRSTIVCNTDIEIDQVGVPRVFATNQVVEEVVQKINRERLMTYVLNGKKRYPGAVAIVKASTGIEHAIDNIKNLVLEDGDIVKRNLLTGDRMYYNRQPSLTISSICGMRIVVNEDPECYTFRMNVAACPFFNADFDGDQMGGIINSTLATQYEQEQIGAMTQFFISHTTSAPATGEVDDGIIGTALLTRNQTRLDKLRAMRLFSKTKFKPDFSAFTPASLLSGRDAMSMMLKKTPIDFTRATEWYNPTRAAYIKYDPEDIKVVIKGGQHISGVLDKRSIGKGAAGGIFHLVANEYGNRAALDLVWNIQQMAIQYIMMTGFTIGVMDLLVPQSTRKEIEQIAGSIIAKADLVTNELLTGEIIPPIGKTIEEHYEERMISILSIFGDFAQVLGGIRPESNNLLQLIGYGSKGKFEQLYNMMSSIGQKTINGERISQLFGHKRTLCSTPRFDPSPSARGYIGNSYISGLNRPEYFFGAMNARFDLISKALSTSITGEINRTNNKNLEHVHTNNYRAVVKGNQKILQPAYGEDFIDARFLKRVSFATVMISDADLAAKYGANATSLVPSSVDASTSLVPSSVDASTSLVPSSGAGKTPAPVLAQYAAVILEDRNKYREMFFRLEQMNVKELLKNERLCPVDVVRIIEKVIMELGAAESTTNGAQPQDVIRCAELVLEARSELKYVFVNDIAKKQKRALPQYYSDACWLTGMLMTIELAPSNIIARKLTPKMVMAVIDLIKLHYVQALVDPGTAVGLIGAQSFSEPLTQYMLDAHHRSASGGTNKGGVVRTKEVLGVKEISTLSAPSMYLPIAMPWATDMAKAQEIANNIEEMILKQFLSVVQLFFEKFRAVVHPKYVEENALIDNFLRLNPILKPPADLVHWCIRLEINKAQLIIKNMSLETIIKKLRDYSPYFYIVYTPENASRIIVRIYMRNELFKTGASYDGLRETIEDLKKLTIRGITGVINTQITKAIRQRVDANGAIVRIDDQYVITTSGTNLIGAMRNKYLDWTQANSDSVIEVYRRFGIEAARQKIIQEMRNIVECSTRHYLIYADVMTSTGYPTSINRGGQGLREIDNPLLRIGTAAPINVMAEAAIVGAVDKVSGVTGPLLLGSTPRIGTSYNALVVNEARVIQHLKTAEQYLNEI